MRDSYFKDITIKRTLLFLFIMTVYFSCSQLTPEEKIIKDTLGKTVEIEIFESIWQGKSEIPFGEFRDRYPFISLVYLEDGCLPCYPIFLEWQTRIDSLETADNFKVLYIILGRSYERFLDNLAEYEPDYLLPKVQPHVVMDPDYRFLDNNMGIERDILDRSILIGPDNRIKLIGPPFASPQMAELFYNIVNSEK